MTICSIFKGMKSLNRYKKPILAPIILIMIVTIFAGCEDAYSPTLKEPLKVYGPAPAEMAVLSKQIKDNVKGLEYSDKVAEDFAKMVMSWRDTQGRQVLVIWKKKLNQAKQEHKQGKISKEQIAKVEEEIARDLGQKMREDISIGGEVLFDLVGVVKYKKANCFGSSNLIYVIGNSVGLPVKAINVVEIMDGVIVPVGHIASIIFLSDDRMIMVDLVIGDFISRPFIIEEEFTKVGNYWELIDKDNPLGIHRRIQMLDKSGIVACRYTTKGNIYSDLGKFPRAISEHNKAIELNPKDVLVYNNRGSVYIKLGEFAKALSDFNRAIELDPKCAKAYFNRGTAYDECEQVKKAIAEYTKAIELNPNFPEAYCNRGNCFSRLGEDKIAIIDYTKAIKLDPKLAEAHFGRGNCFSRSDQNKLAIVDYTKAIELDPKLIQAYNNRAVAYAYLGKFEEAKEDLLKVVKLNPALNEHVKNVSDEFKLNLKLD